MSPLPKSPRPGRFPRLAFFAVFASSPLGAQDQPLPEDQPLPPPPPLTGAIYFDAWQLEKEFVVSPLALQQWVDLGLTAGSRLDAAARDALKPGIGEFLATRCPITIKGEPVEFTLDRIHFIEPNQAEFIRIEPDAIVSPAEVRVSVVFAAPNPDLTSPLQIIWDLFPEGQPTVPLRTADVAGTRSTNLASFAPSITVRGRYKLDARETPRAPPVARQVTWTIPSLSILLILIALPVCVRLVRSERPRAVALVVLLALAGGAAATRKIATFQIPSPFGPDRIVGPEQSAVILDGLLRGVYHAFNYRTEGEQYDALARVVDGEALTDIYLEVQRTLESRQRDGARVRVSRLTIEEAQPSPLDDRRGFDADCSWLVRGRVGHWGHFHDRFNRYHATFVVEPRDEFWKITAFTLHDRDREVNPNP